ncbi:PIG-L family deacetylase [Corynebacterium testudinoris]|uniref:PIG-L deacetylase family protein n=1 Tax=Corynebacterium testudinoris TaxID=136857 RepID=UPI001C8B920F|nr:PIG-L deacetylase family protein [Corynebacterium testudinoris]MBX8996896.1 PIG-L family deacetylase [Corynebacterium testudinoris]
MFFPILTALGALAAIVFVLTPRGRSLLSRRFRSATRLRAIFIGLMIPLIVVQLLELTLPHGHWMHELFHLVTLLAMVTLLFILFTARVRPTTYASDVTRTVLAVGAHPDDLEIACGGTLAKMADGGHHVHGLVLSDGQVGGDASVRPDEARAGANFLELESITVHAFPDTRLAEHDGDLVRAIEERIREIKPDVILTHSRNDHHQDHHAVHLATLRAGRRHPTILCFESPSTTRNFNPNYFVNISEYLGAKVHAVSRHIDQAGKPYMKPDKLRGIASFRGSQAKIDVAEGFEIVRALDDSLWSVK